jgi:hypothetical protein
MISKVKAVVVNGGYNVSSNGSINLKFIAGYSELVNTIKLQQMLNNDVNIKAKIPSPNGKSQVVKLGTFRIKQTVIDGDGESKLQFNGLTDYVEVDNINLLPLNNDDVKEFTILMEAELEVESEESENDE